MITKRTPELCPIECRAKLPAAVWRSLAESERPLSDERDIAYVDVDDSGHGVVVMSGRRFSQLVRYLDSLERDTESGETP